MATIREVIEQVCELRPNAFTEMQLTKWLARLDGRLAGDVYLLSHEDMQKLNYRWPENADTELLVPFPHSDIYEHWLCSQIDMANGEYDKYNNDTTMFNTCLDEFIAWYARVFAPAAGGPGSCQGEAPPYYLSAYAIAKKLGYQGTEEEWLQSLVPNVSIGEVKTLESWEEAQVSLAGSVNAPVLNFGLPKGKDGSDGWKNTPFKILREKQNKRQISWKKDGTTTQQEDCSDILKCPRFLGWHLEGESRMWLYIGDLVDGEFVRDAAYDISESSSGAINYLNPSHNRFIETDGTKYFWYKIAKDEGVTLLEAETFPDGMKTPGIVPDFVTNDGSHKTSGDYYSIVIPSGSHYAVLVKNGAINAMNVSWETPAGVVVSKGASFGSIPQGAGAALLRIPNDCPLENITVYCSKPVFGSNQNPPARKITHDLLSFQWISRKSILWNDATATYFDEGRRFTGVPYSSRWFNAHYLGYEITPTTLANALNDPYSIAYDGGITADGRWNVTEKTEIGTRGGTGYGLVCSVLQCLLNGNPYPQSNRGFTFDSNFWVVPLAGPMPGATLMNKDVSHSVLLDEVYDRGYSFVEAEDPCACRTVHTNGMEKPGYLKKKTDMEALKKYAYTVNNADVSGYQKNLLDFENIEVPEGKVRPWRGHKAVYGTYDKEPDSSGILLTVHETSVVRLFIPGESEPVYFYPREGTRFLDITEWVMNDGTYTVDSGEGTVAEQFRYFERGPVGLHFLEDGTATFDDPDAEYAYVTVTGYGSGFATEKAAGDDPEPIVIAAGKKYPDLARDLSRIKKIRGVMMSDPTKIMVGNQEVSDSWGRFASYSGGKSSAYKEPAGSGGGTAGVGITDITITEV